MGWAIGLAMGWAIGCAYDWAMGWAWGGRRPKAGGRPYEVEQGLPLTAASQYIMLQLSIIAYDYIDE